MGHFRTLSDTRLNIVTKLVTGWQLYSVFVAIYNLQRWVWNDDR